MIRSQLSIAGLVLVASIGSLPAAVLIDHTFDGVANDTGGYTFQQMGNGIGSGSANLSTGVISVGSTAINGNWGFNTTTSLNLGVADPAATGFEITFYVSATNVDMTSLAYNGLFFGVTTGTNANGTAGTSLWVNDPYGFGYVAGSGNSSTPGYGNNVMRQDAQGGATNDSNSVTTALGGTAPTNASYKDGFTVTVGLFNDDTWTVTSTGLSTNLNGSGSLTTTGTGMFDYATISSSLTPFVSMQGLQNGTITVDRIVVDSVAAIPEPSSACLLLVAGLLLVVHRRR